MKSVLLLLSFVALTLTASAHEYFFAFAEVSYNEKSGVLEATVISSAHETEEALNSAGIQIKELEDHYKDSVMIQKLEGFINKGFSMQFGETATHFTLVGYEVNTKGMVNFYLTSQPITITDSYAVSFDLLMDELPEQQNKLIFNARKKDHTAVFLHTKRTQQLTL